MQPPLPTQPQLVKCLQRSPAHTGRETYARRILFKHHSASASTPFEGQPATEAQPMAPAFPPESDEPEEELDQDEIEALLADDEDDPSLDDEFPLGDGVADISTEVYCPYCGEPVEIALDPGSGSHQSYVEDCQVCCQPWRVSVSYHEDGHASVHVTAEDEL